ncbi:MAG: EF-hand domain-containing protein [Sphingomicrobium sp.]
MVPFLAMMLAAAPLPIPAFNPRAVELIESDPALKQWALRIYDTNHDGWLSLYEAQPAVAAFRDIADGDHDQRVTVREFESGLAFIRARY